MITRIMYNLVGIPLMYFGFFAGAIFSRKIRKGILGRINEEASLLRVRNRCPDDHPRIIVHCASAGELESAIPIIEQLRKAVKASIILTYYSPSALDRAKKVKGVTGHLYLPFDSQRRMSRMLDLLQPHAVIMVKHDIWPNLVWCSKEREIPTVLVNANFRPDSSRLFPVLNLINRSILGSLTTIVTIAEDDAERFRKVAGSTPKIVVLGDSRFDRVEQRARSGYLDQGVLKKALVDKQVIVAGSTWPEDEKQLISAWSQLAGRFSKITLVIVPHEPTSEHLVQIRERCTDKDLESSLLSEISTQPEIPDVTVVDQIGILAGLYGLGCAAYVGGGFGHGVHSVIEPAVFGLPVFFGPNYRNSHEARDLLALEEHFLVRNSQDMEERFAAALSREDRSTRAGALAREYVHGKSGVASGIVEEIRQLIA